MFLEWCKSLGWPGLSAVICTFAAVTATASAKDQGTQVCNIKGLSQCPEHRLHLEVTHQQNKRDFLPF